MKVWWWPRKCWRRCCCQEAKWSKKLLKKHIMKKCLACSKHQRLTHDSSKVWRGLKKCWEKESCQEEKFAIWRSVDDVIPKIVTSAWQILIRYLKLRCCQEVNEESNTKDAGGFYLKCLRCMNTEEDSATRSEEVLEYRVVREDRRRKRVCMWMWKLPMQWTGWGSRHGNSDVRWGGGWRR